MKIILVTATSVNGKITKGNGRPISEWLSPEDNEFFNGMVAKHRLLVMGRTTFVAAGRPDLTQEKLRIVYSHNPGQYQAEAVAGKVEFTSEDPRELIKRLEAQGFEDMLLVSGSQVTRLFLELGLVDEVYLTFEPCLIGGGKLVIAEGDLEVDVQLRLLEVTRLNETGTLQMHYEVLHS